MLEQQECGLLIIDVQGKLARAVADSAAVIQSIATLIKGAQLLGLPVIQIEQLPDKLGATVDELAQLLPANGALPKHTFSALGNEQITQQIRAAGRKQWLVCGIETHICVYQTVMDLLAEGFEVEVVNDAVSSRNPANRQLAVDKMVQAGAALTCVEMVLFELLKEAGSEEFKATLGLIK